MGDRHICNVLDCNNPAAGHSFMCEEHCVRALEGLSFPMKPSAGFPHNTPARVLEWREFAAHMEGYIAENTVAKYGDAGADLASQTPPQIMAWNIVRYATRLFRGFGKQYDLQKIAHYACMAWAKKG